MTQDVLKYLQPNAVVPIDMETTAMLVNALRQAIKELESRKLVAAKEREACAKKAEAQNCHMVAAAIRARGEA